MQIPKFIKDIKKYFMYLMILNMVELNYYH